jgi:O-succinylbenzoic acid--CoA ligase
VIDDPTPPSLRPVTGGPREVERLVGEWLVEDRPEPLTVRTSGSISGPKDVLLSAKAVRASATATLARIGGPGQWVLALPAHYVAGLQVIARSILSRTSPVLLDDHADLRAATASLTGSRRYLALVPTQLHRFLQSPQETEALTAYDCVLLGGSAAPDSLLVAARDADVRVVTTYGMSETCGGCVYDGVALDGVAVAVDSDGAIRIGGAVLFEGYAARPDLTDRVLRDGWFHTSDLGRVDDDGRLVVLGRSDDVVVSGGVNISLAAVERRLRSMPDLGHVAVTARRDAEWGAEVVAVVERGSAQVPGLDQVRDHVAAELPRTWAPRHLVVVPVLPMLDSGKVDRQQLARLAEEAGT